MAIFRFVAYEHVSNLFKYLFLLLNSHSCKVEMGGIIAFPTLTKTFFLNIKQCENKKI